MEKIIVNIEVEKLGIIEVELYPEVAPVTVENFVNLINKNYYENSYFHRVIRGFMIQGGIGKTREESIVGEFSSNGHNNELKHTRGVISMARTMIPNSASTQFFIMHLDSPHLDGEYAAFGKVISGIEVVDEIASTKTDRNDEPLERVVINNITIQK